MSLFVPKFDESVIVREADAEVVGGDPTRVRLLADSNATGGALSTVRVTLGEGADGAVPHLHRNSHFRHLQRLRLGEATLESLLEVQELYDNHYLKSVAWEQRH